MGEPVSWIKHYNLMVKRINCAKLGSLHDFLAGLTLGEHPVPEFPPLLDGVINPIYFIELLQGTEYVLSEYRLVLIFLLS